VSVFPFKSLHSSAGARYHYDVLLLPSPNPGDNLITNTTNVPTMSMLLVLDSSLQLQQTPPTNLLESVTSVSVVGLAPAEAARTGASSSVFAQGLDVASTAQPSTHVPTVVSALPIVLSPA
jgi:hypothetical protein